jgi:hypothetical protein
MYPSIAAAVSAAIHESNLSTLDKFVTYLSDHIDDDGVAEIRQHMNQFKVTMTEEHVDTLKKSKKEKAGALPKKKREPTPYNKFIGETMKALKTENPSTSGKEIMKMAMDQWKAMSESEKAEYRSNSSTSSKSDAEEEEDHNSDVESAPEPEPEPVPAAKQTKRGGKKTKA